MTKDTLYYYFKLVIGLGLSGLGVLVLLFVKHFNAKLLTILLMLLAGWTLIIIGFLILKRSKLHIIKKLEKELKENISFLKNKGELRKILFSNLTIGARSEIHEEYTSFPSKVVILDGMYGIDRRKKKVRLDYSVITYEERINEKSQRYYSPEIDKDYITLSFLLEKKNQIDLYIDKGNRNNYYFDLEFLKNK